MKTKYFLAFILLCNANTKTFCQEHIRIVSTQVRKQFLESKPGGKSSDVIDIPVKVEYWIDATAPPADVPINFAIQNNAGAPNSTPVIAAVASAIERGKFKTTHDTAEFIVAVTIIAFTPFIPEFFTIGLSGTTTDNGVMGVTLQKDKVEEKADKTPLGLTYMNAVNFDFDGTGGSSYVGHLNVFKYDAFYRSKNTKITIGLNCGILKTNFSRQDSLQESIDYSENILIRPLDEIKVGNEYLRQYNNKSNVTKNVAWSYYFQPTIGLYCRQKFKLLFHLHGEYFVNKFTTITTIRNYQQAKSTFTTDNIDEVKKDIAHVNKFEKSLTDPVLSRNAITKGNFNFGAGITIDVTLWHGGSMFVQGTVGKAIDYVRPENVDSKTLSYSGVKKQSFAAHLARYILSQQITNNMQAQIGVEIRGRFGETPTYSSFVGVNIGLEGLKKLLN
ncbi:MAG: hypothetical protein ABIN01_24635 [Ferruginibacter sp.]